MALEQCSKRWLENACSCALATVIGHVPKREGSCKGGQGGKKDSEVNKLGWETVGCMALILAVYVSPLALSARLFSCFSKSAILVFALASCTSVMFNRWLIFKNLVSVNNKLERQKKGVFENYKWLFYMALEQGSKDGLKMRAPAP